MTATNRFETLLSDIFDISEREAGRLMNPANPVSQSTVNRWSKTDAPPTALSRVFGVRYDWLIGESDTVWSDRVFAIRRELRTYLASLAYSPKTPSERFRIVTTWLIENHGDLVTERYLAALLRLIDHYGKINDFHDMASGVLSATNNAMQRLAAWCNVPEAWFTYGTANLSDDVEYQRVIEKAKSRGVRPGDIERFIDAQANVLA